MIVSAPSIQRVEGGYRLSFTLPRESLMDARKMVEKYRNGKPLTLTVKPFRKPRSVDANAYCWVLCQALGEALGVPKERVYRQHVKDVGPFFTAVYDAPEASGVARCWQQNGLGWIAELEDNFDGTDTVYLYPGSSTYDTAQMSRLIDSLIQDCDDLGLDVQIPEEVRSLIESLD